MQPESKVRSVNLDVLRGLAILLVIGKHIPLPSGDPITGLLLRMGWAGVDLFFVLSGFLVAGLIFDEHLKTGTFQVRRFFARRALRIYPPFYFLLLVTVPLLLLNPQGRAYFAHAALHDVLFIQNYLPGTWGQLWSLAVEEHCYILLAGLVFLLEKTRSLRLIPWLFLSVFAVPCLVMRIATQQRHPSFDVLTHLIPTHLRIDSLMFGVLLAYCWRFRPRLFRLVSDHRAVALTVAALLLAPLGFLGLEHPWMHTWGFSVNYLGFGLLLCIAVTSGEWRGLRVVGAIGRYSYSIYLWLFPVAFFVAALPIRSTLLSLGVYLTATLAVGVMAAAAVEAPALRLREMLCPQRRAARHQVTTKISGCLPLGGSTVERVLQEVCPTADQVNV